jgi:glycyl-tRNA synthetase beta subunit
MTIQSCSEEVTGLVSLGRARRPIDADFMALPPEVLATAMQTRIRYFHASA